MPRPLPGEMRPDAAAGVAAVNRALSLLAAFSVERPVLTLAQLAAHTGLYKSTILRLAQSLTAFGYLSRTEEGSFMLGPTPLRLAAVYQGSLHPAEQVMPVLRALARDAGESAALYVRAGRMRLCAYRAPSPRAVSDNVREGDLLPLDRGAGGQVLLAFSGHPGLRHEATRQRMLVVTRGERDPETAAIAAPVFGRAQRLQGALSLSGPVARFMPDAIPGMQTLLLAAARTLTQSFGGDAAIYQRASLTN